MTEIDWRARAEAAEAERDEALTALGEHVIATEHDRDEYLALQRVIVQRDNELEAAEARIAAVEAIDWAAEINWSDGSAHYLDAERLVRAALAEPVEPQPSACARCGDIQMVPVDDALEWLPCPSCTPPDPAS